ncbi:MAG: hypothetical protein WCO86_11745, partial [Planctomycetota bacterium]
MFQRTLLRSLLLLLLGTSALAAENELTSVEKAAGWTLLFDGKTTAGWLDSKEQPVPTTHVKDGSLNPHPCNY